MNQSKPVNRLPPEIFSKVLEFRKNERDLIVATQVCARWRAILTSTPFLWTKVDFEDSSRASLYLERSKTLLIDVTVGKTRSCIVGPEGAFLGAIPWVARMKSLHVQAGEEQIKTIAARLCHATPNLRFLTLKAQARQYYSNGNTSNSTGGGAIYVPSEFLGRHAPLLQSLTFSSISPSVVFSFPLPKLTHIDWVAENAYVVIEELLDLFASSPLIEDIKMHVKVRRTRTYESLREVTLSKLRKLDWADHDGSISLINCLTAPRLDDLAVRITRDARNPHTALSAILPPHAHYLPLLVEPKGLEYIYQHGSRSCRFYYERGAAFSIREVTKSRLTESTIARWLSPHSPISFGRTLSLHVEASGGCPPLEDIPIEELENLQTLGLTGDTDALVPLLRPKRGTSGDVLSVPCPMLSEVRIIPKDAYFQLDELTEILRMRKAAGRGVKNVRIMGEARCQPGQIKELKKFVGELIAS